VACEQHDQTPARRVGRHSAALALRSQVRVIDRLAQHGGAALVLAPECADEDDVAFDALQPQTDKLPCARQVAPREFAEQLLLAEQVSRIAQVRIVAHDAGDVSDEIRFVFERDAALMRLLVGDGMRQIRRRHQPVVIHLAGPRKVEAAKPEMIHERAGEERLRGATAVRHTGLQAESRRHARVRRFERGIQRRGRAGSFARPAQIVRAERLAIRLIRRVDEL